MAGLIALSQDVSFWGVRADWVGPTTTEQPPFLVGSVVGPGHTYQVGKRLTLPGGFCIE